MEQVNEEGLSAVVSRALTEDLGDGDITSEATVPADARAHARIVQKEPGVVFGFEAAAEVFSQVGADGLDASVIEGRWRETVPADIAFVAGSARALLAGERVALNLLGRLSGVATLTARYVEAASAGGGRATILDTRKTTPGLRVLEKAAVRAGGGRNHRMGLHDAILIKENHVALAGGLTAAVKRARESQPTRSVEVECSNPEEVEAALEAGAERLLLDNMEVADLAAAVAVRDAAAEHGGGRVELEASGGISLESVGDVSAAGVDFISVGSLTHSAPTLDLSMLLEPA